MKFVIYKIISFITAIIGVFMLGSKSGKKKQKNKYLKNTLNNVKKAKKIQNKTAKLSRNSKLNRL